MIALCTLLSGGEDCSDMALFGEIKAPYLRQFLRLRHGTPSHDTFSRVFRLLADSDEGGHPFQSHRGHHSNLMAARPDHPRRSILLMSWSGNQGQAEARSLRRLSPLSSMRWAAWTTRSRTASARVGSPTISYQRPIGTWLVMISEPVL